jgi:hypothetical protein
VKVRKREPPTICWLHLRASPKSTALSLLRYDLRCLRSTHAHLATLPLGSGHAPLPLGSGLKRLTAPDVLRDCVVAKRRL